MHNRRSPLLGGAMLLLSGCYRSYYDNYCSWSTWDWYKECDLIEGRGCKPNWRRNLRGWARVAENLTPF